MRLKLKFLFGLSLYAGTSYYFLKHPELLHVKKNKLKLPPRKYEHYMIAHRGGSKEAPENTLQAFQNAVNQGFEILEMDVRATKDNVIIVCHDENFLRLCGVEKNVKDINHRDIPEFLPKLPLHFHMNMQYERKPEDSKTFSTLQEVFENIPRDIVMQIDMKDHENLEAQKELIRIVRKYGREQTTILGSEREEVTRSLHHLAPDIPKFIPSEFGFKMIFAYFFGFIPFMRIPYDVSSAPFMTDIYFKMKLQEGKEKPWIFYPYIVFISLMNWAANPMMEHFNKRGILTNYWVINEERDIRKIIRNHKIQGIMTDRPTLLASIQKEIISKQEEEQIEIEKAITLEKIIA